MAHEDSGWRPEGATETYDGFEVWDHGVWPNEYNHGDVEHEHDDHDHDHDDTGEDADEADAHDSS